MRACLRRLARVLSGSMKHLHIHVEVPGLDRLEAIVDATLLRLGHVQAKLDLVLDALNVIQDQEEHAMLDLSALQSEVQQNTDVVASAVSVLGALAQEIRDAANDPAAIQALADSLDANSQSLAAAVAATGDVAAPAEPPVEPPA